MQVVKITILPALGHLPKRTTVRTNHPKNKMSNQSSSQQQPNTNAFVGPGNTSLGVGPVIPDSMPAPEPNKTSSTEKQEGTSHTTQYQSQSTGQGDQKNPFRGPGGMKLGHGPRVDHLPKNQDGTYRLQKAGDQPGGEASAGGHNE